MLSVGEKVDPRVVRTRRLLIDSFMNLLGEKGFDALTVQDITARATVNRATFYAHFADKYAMVDEIIREEFARFLQERLDPRPSMTYDVLNRLFLAVTDHLTRINNNCPRTYRTFESLVEAQIKEQLRDALREWLLAQPTTQRTPRQRLDLAATLISWSLYGAALEWSKQGRAHTAEDFAAAALPLIAATVREIERG